MISEAAFADIVQRWLEAEFGATNVFPEVELGTDRRPDFIVDAPGRLVLMVEVENRREDVIMGAGQALLYATHDALRVPVGTPDATFVPTVVIPGGVSDAVETAMLAQHVHLVELDPDAVADE